MQGEKENNDLSVGILSVMVARVKYFNLEITLKIFHFSLRNILEIHLLHITTNK